MKGVIRLGDATDHGGKVISASEDMIIEGKGVARVGDMVTCPKKGHGPTTVIVEGDDLLKDHGKPIALDGHKCACGCQLISSVKHVGRN